MVDTTVETTVDTTNTRRMAMVNIEPTIVRMEIIKLKRMLGSLNLRQRI